jgi:hypothetical protein
LGDQNDHTWALTVDGSRPLTADWDAGSFDITAEQLIADTTTQGEGGNFGNAFTGIYIGAANYAVWCEDTHKASNTDYALMQQSDGTTYLNCKSGSGGVSFRYGNAVKMLLTTELDMSVDIDMTSSYSLLNVGGLTAAADLDIGSYDITAEQLYADTTTAGEGIYAGNPASNLGLFVGIWPSAVTYGGIANNAVRGTGTSYGFLQNNVGATILNAAAGQTITLAIGTGQICQVSGSGFDMNNYDIFDVDDIIGNGATRISGGDAAGEDLYLSSTTHATKGTVFIADDGGDIQGGDNAQFVVEAGAAANTLVVDSM